MNNKGQGLFVGIIIFAAIVLGMLIISPFILKAVGSIHGQFANAINNTSPEAADAARSTTGTLISWWDQLVMFLIFGLIVVLLVSSFLIDVHPFFIIVFLIVGILLFAFGPTASTVLYKIYENPGLSTEVAEIPLLEFLVQHFWSFMLGVFFLCGVIIFIKIRFFPSTGGAR